MNCWFNEWRTGYFNRVLVIKKIVKPYRRERFATAEDIRNGSQYMMKLKRARLERSVSSYVYRK